MDSKPYPAGHQPTLAVVAMAVRAAQRAGECPLQPLDVALVLCVASEEHALGHRQVPTFTPAQLCCRLGCAKEDTLFASRRRAVAAGWLHFEHRGRKAGAYWVLVPAMFHVPQWPPFGGVHPVERGRSTGAIDGVNPADDPRGTDPFGGGHDLQAPPNGADRRGEPRETGPIGGGHGEGSGVGSSGREEQQQQLLQQPPAREGGGGEGMASGPATSVTTAPASVLAVLATIADPSLRARLGPLAVPSLGLRPAEVAEDLLGWISVTDGLLPDEVAMVLIIRHKHPPLAHGQPVPFRFPTHFTQLRTRYEAARRDLAERRTNQRQLDAIAAPGAPVTAQLPPPASELVDPWRRAVESLRPGNDALRTRWATWIAPATVYPVGLDGETLVLHVPSDLFHHTIRARYAGDIAAAISEALGQPVTAVRYQVNGHAHPKATALAGVTL